IGAAVVHLAEHIHEVPVHVIPCVEGRMEGKPNALVGLVISLVAGRLTVASFRAGMTAAAGLALAGAAVGAVWIPGRGRGVR
ncbi:MAG: hypothetical protein ACXVZL_13035, partial [Gaiellaceae bacterium]